MSEVVVYARERPGGARTKNLRGGVWPSVPSTQPGSAEKLSAEPVAELELGTGDLRGSEFSREHVPTILLFHR